MEHKANGDTNCDWCTWNDPQRLGKRAGGVGNRRTRGDNQNYCFVEVGQNTETIPGDLKLPVTQTLAQDHQLTLMRETRQN